MSDWLVKDSKRGVERPFESRSEAEEKAGDMKELIKDRGGDPERVDVIPPNEGENQSVDVVDHSNGSGAVVEESKESAGDTTQKDTNGIEATPDQFGDALAEIGDSIETDPLDVLPGYMITHVDGKPSLNKRGVSVLAYHYDIDVVEREVVAYPHEHDYETAVVEIMVKNSEGRKFSGVGEAHANETPKHQLLRMAETRAYKRAVIFATGTGIVGYQELMGELE
jgi:hypothetical protein